MGSGTALIITGIIVGNDDGGSGDPNELDFGPNFDVGLWLLGGGVAAGLASIPFFVGSAKNAQKAATIGISHQRIRIPQGSGQVTILQPTVSLKVRL